MKWLENMLEGLFGSSKKIKNLDLTEASKPIAQQLVEKPVSALERRSIAFKAAAARKAVLKEEPFRNFSAEHKAHLERYDAFGNLKPELGGGAIKSKDGSFELDLTTQTVKWHVGIAVKGSGDVKRDIREARERLFDGFPTVEESDMSDEELEEHIKDLQIREAKAAGDRLGGHVAERMSEIEAKHERRKAERIQRRRREAEAAATLAAAEAERLELEELAMLATAEVDERFSRF